MLHVAADSDRHFPRHTHDEYGIGVMEAGAQRWISGRGVVEASAGAVITLNPGEVHDGLPVGGPRVWRMLYFNPALVAEVCAAEPSLAARDYEFVVPALVHAGLAARVRRMLAAYRAAPKAADLACDELQVELLIAMAARPRPRREPALAAVDLARAALDEDYAREWRLAELAALTGLSRYQTLRAFQRALGLTPHEYRTQRRLRRARELIARRTSLARAAAESGFADQSHMNRLFLRAYGYTPGDYARGLQ